jgi:hypothetical protein
VENFDVHRRKDAEKLMHRGGKMWRRLKHRGRLVRLMPREKSAS